MARAKRTDRAEARRRYRATLTEDLPIDDEAELASESESDAAADRTAVARSRPRSPATGSSGSIPRPSIIGAFKAAFRPTDLRGDIAALPGLLRNRSFFIPFVMIVAAAVVIAVTGGTEPISRTLSPYFLAPPPVAPVFLAGFLAPRASWLIGGLLGMIASIAILVLVTTPAMQQVVTGSTAATGLEPDVVASAFLVSTVGGAFYAAAAAWYKRFLALASPSRAVRQANRTTGKPTGSRRRGPDERPLLARRR